jgi:phosphoglycerate dehydrogenase-like enzyme
VSERFRVYITDFSNDISLEAGILHDVAILSAVGARTENELLGKVDDADALIVYHDIERLGEATFERTPRCLAVVRAGVGYNNVDLIATSRRGIVVCNVPDYGTEDVADHAIALLLAVARQILPCDASIRRGEWDFGYSSASPRLRGKTLGLIGCGRIGTATAMRAKAFGFDVVIYDPYVAHGLEKALGVRRVDRLEALLEQSQFVSLHCYLDAKTRHIVNRDALARIPSGGILINTARGPLVDQKALVDALDSGHLLGAGLDVVEQEPLDDERLRTHPKVVLTPHSAFYSIEGYEELRRKTAEEVRRILLGQPPRSPVNLGTIVDPRANLG